MNARRICAPLLLVMLMTVCGCSVTHKVDTDAADAWKKELMNLSESVKHVSITFTRPDVTCRITLKEEPSQQLLDSIVASARTFATVDTMKTIAKSLKWGLDISEIHMTIDSDGDPKTIEHAYYARYFKTFDASDHSDSNIEAYATWYELKTPSP
ncbi:hypothetical protein [Paenibacillus sp. MBLB4367]|uniref:hypothetical protein n=1 Tax=Paenibacillus sp. MBLB4367 TaxID=3384767 RepID=UPI003908224B